MTDLVIPDISEYQGTPNLAGQQAVIIRAHNGWRADTSFTKNRENAHQAGCKAVGIYQYLPASADAASCARSLVAMVGKLLPGEWLICDLEEGSGYQEPRYEAWAAVCRPFSPVTWLYSGLYLSEADGLQPDWLADYTNVEPTFQHRLWQNTDAYQFPWGKSDASLFHGTIDQLVALINPPPPAPPKPPASPAPEEIEVPDIFVATGNGTAYVINELLGTRRWIPTPADEGPYTTLYGKPQPLSNAALKGYTPIGDVGPNIP